MDCLQRAMERLGGALEGRVLAGVDGEDRFGFVGDVGEQGRFDLRLEIVEAFAGDRADEDRLGGEGGVPSQIGFVCDQRARDIFRQLERRRGVGLVRLDDVEQKLGVGHHGAGAAIALDFDGIGRVALAGGVDEAQGQAADVALGLDQVARGARRGRDDGAVLAQERIEQARLADVRLADDDGQRAFLENAAQRRGADELVDFLSDAFDARGELGPDARLDSFLGEIEAGFEMAEQVDQFRADGLERVAEAAFLHGAGAGQRAFGRGVEQGEQAFRLRERKLVVEKSALGEFAGPRRPRADLEARLDDVFDDVRIAVA